MTRFATRHAICATALALTAAGLAGCAPGASQIPPVVLNVHASSAAYPWLETAYDCAAPSTALRVTNPDSADFSLRLGEPAHLVSPAFQIGVEDLLIVVHPAVAAGPLSLERVERIFAGEVMNWQEVGGADLAVQVWTYSSGEDLQEYFDRAVMDGRPIGSLARLAVSAQAMSDSVGSVNGSIGFLPRRWKAGNTREVLVLPSLPVLAIVPSEPQGALKTLLSCMQSRSTGGLP